MEQKTKNTKIHEVHSSRAGDCSSSQTALTQVDTIEKSDGIVKSNHGLLHVKVVGPSIAISEHDQARTRNLEENEVQSREILNVRNETNIIQEQGNQETFDQGYVAVGRKK